MQVEHNNGKFNLLKGHSREIEEERAHKKAKL